MSNFLIIRKKIYDILKLSTSNVFYSLPSDTVGYPRVVFEFVHYLDCDWYGMYSMDIDIWDNSRDTTVIETLCDNINSSLINTTIDIDGNGYLNIMLQSTANEDKIEKEKYLRNRKLMYQINYIGG